MRTLLRRRELGPGRGEAAEAQAHRVPAGAGAGGGQDGGGGAAGRGLQAPWRRAEESGEITGRMGDALERLLGTGDDPEVGEAAGACRCAGGAAWRRWRRRCGTASAVRSVGLRLRARRGRGETVPRVQAQDGEHDDGAGRSETRAAPPVAGLRPKKPFTERRLDPEIVTEEPDDDDWRSTAMRGPWSRSGARLRADHPHQGKSLSWLTTEERLLTCWSWRCWRSTG